MDLSFNKWDMPMVKTTLTVKANGRQTSIEGNFIADMGNASPSRWMNMASWD